MTSWFRQHHSAIFATALALSNAGVFGKTAAAIAMAVAAACGAHVAQQ